MHVYRDGTQIVKWNLEADRPMEGTATRRILKLIEKLRAEGKL